jgi:hypothetical protein
VLKLIAEGETTSLNFQTSALLRCAEIFGKITNHDNNNNYNFMLLNNSMRLNLNLTWKKKVNKTIKDFDYEQLHSM